MPLADCIMPFAVVMYCIFVIFPVLYEILCHCHLWFLYCNYYMRWMRKYIGTFYVTLDEPLPCSEVGIA